MIGDLFEAAPTFDDPLGMLRACHRRIERALDLMGRIADLEGKAPLDERARQVLRQTLHYFAVGVPRHAADEDESLFPRVRCLTDAEESGAVVDTVRALSSEHLELAALHSELEVLGQALLRTGRFDADSDRSRFRQVVLALGELYAEHIRREDEELFPLAERAVSAEDLEAIGAEMASRRGIDWSVQRELVAALHDSVARRVSPPTAT